MNQFICNFEDCKYETYRRRRMKEHLENHNIDEDFDINANCLHIVNQQITSETRRCSSCYIIKNNVDFKVDKNDNFLKKCLKCSEFNKKNRERPEVKKKMREHRKNYEERHKEEIRVRKNEWSKENLKKFPEKKLIKNLRSRIYVALSLKYTAKCDTTTELLGCKMDFFRQWLEFNFQYDEEMTFDNYGTYWQIDHVIPCSSFDLKTLESQKKCFGWMNSRPLEARKNNIKNDTYQIKEILVQEIRVKLFMKQATKPN